MGILTPLVQTGCLSPPQTLQPLRLRPASPREELSHHCLALTRATVLSSSSLLPSWSSLIPKLEGPTFRVPPVTALLCAQLTRALAPFHSEQKPKPLQWSWAPPVQAAVTAWDGGGSHRPALTFPSVPLEPEVRGQRRAAWFPLRPGRRVCPCPPASGGLLAVAGAPWGVDAAPISASISVWDPLLRVCLCRVLG